MTFIIRPNHWTKFEQQTKNKKTISKYVFDFGADKEHQTSIYLPSWDVFANGHGEFILRYTSENQYNQHDIAFLKDWMDMNAFLNKTQPVKKSTAKKSKGSAESGK